MRSILRLSMITAIAASASVAFSSSARAVEAPGFGTLAPTASPNWFQSDFGLLGFPNPADMSAAWNASLNLWLSADANGVYSAQLGTLTPNPQPQWLNSSLFGPIHFGINGTQYNGFIWSEFTDWVKFVSDQTGTYVWITRLLSWGAIQPNGTLYSFDYRTLVPTQTPGAFFSEVFGPILAGDPVGWIFSEEFGHLWAARNGQANQFFSTAREEWLGVTPQGGIWSPREQRFLERPSSDGAPPGFSLSNVTWLHTNVSNWPETAVLDSVDLSGGRICMNYRLTTSWPSTNISGTAVNANPWIITQVNGQWYAGTWEWLRPGQKCKPIGVVNGAHVKRSPLSGGWSPRSGETVGIFVSAPARFGQATVAERSNIVWVVWP